MVWLYHKVYDIIYAHSFFASSPLGLQHGAAPDDG